MASVLAIVSKAVFEKAAPDAELGQVLDMAYASGNKALDVLGAGDALCLVTVRPPSEQLWLVAILESPKLTGGAWRARNAAPLTDITSVLPSLELESGVGVTFKKGALGMTLQAPRRLAPEGANRLRALGGGKPAKQAKSAKQVESAKQSTPAAAPAKAKSGKLADQIRDLGIKGARCDDEESVALDAYLWVRHAPEIAALGRVRHLQLFKAGGRDLEEAMQRPELAQMTSLSLARNRILEPEATSIASSPYLAKIEALDLKYSSISGKSLARIVTMHAPKLRELDLEGNKVGAVGARAIAHSPYADQLTKLVCDVEKLIAQERRKAPEKPVALKAPPKPATTKQAADARGPALVEKLATHFDEATRSVYVDWLLEQNDGRAELAQLDARWVGGDESVGVKLFRAQSRLAKEFGQRYRFKSARLAYAHGLLVEVEARAAFFIDNGAELFASEPVRSVVLSAVTAKDWPKLANVPGMQRVEWLSVEEDHVAAAIAAFPKTSIAVQEPDELDDLFSLAGADRIRGLTLSRADREDVERYAKEPRLAKITRVDFDGYFSSAVFPEYREETDPMAVLKLGWKLAWIGTRIVLPEHLARLRSKVTDVVMRYD